MTKLSLAPFFIAAMLLLGACGDNLKIVEDSPLMPWKYSVSLRDSKGLVDGRFFTSSDAEMVWSEMAQVFRDEGRPVTGRHMRELIDRLDSYDSRFLGAFGFIGVGPYAASRRAQGESDELIGRFDEKHNSLCVLNVPVGLSPKDVPPESRSFTVYVAGDVGILVSTRRSCDMDRVFKLYNLAAERAER